MDMKMQAFLDKVKDMADKTGKVSRHAAGVAGKKANDLALATRINLQIFDLNTECEALYKEIGKLVYDLHRGAEVTNEEMDEKLVRRAVRRPCQLFRQRGEPPPRAPEKRHRRHGEHHDAAARQAGGNALGNGVPALRQTVRQG